MTKLLRRLLSGWRGRRIHKDAAILASRLDALNERATKQQQRVEKLQIQLQSIFEEIAQDGVVERAERRVLQGQIEDLAKAQTTYQGEADRLRQELKVAEATINQLVAANKLILERYDADTAVQVRRQVAQEP